MKKQITIFSLFIVFTFLVILKPVDAEAFLFHATSKAVAKRIIRRGINPARFRAKARFGRGFYLSTRKSTALAEKGRARTLIRLRKGPGYKKIPKIDLRNPSSRKMKSLLGKKYDLRGAVKKKYVGPKLGRRLGKIAEKKRNIIKYRSVKGKGKGKGINIFVPKKVFKNNPRIVLPDKIVGK